MKSAAKRCAGDGRRNSGGGQQALAGTHLGQHFLESARLGVTRAAHGHAAPRTAPNEDEGGPWNKISEGALSEHHSTWGISSLVERPLRMREAPGSIPGFSNIFRQLLFALSCFTIQICDTRAASASVAVSTHSRGPPYPRAVRSLFLTHLLACHVISFARRFPCRLLLMSKCVALVACLF